MGILLSAVILFWMFTPEKFRTVRTRIAKLWWKTSEATRWMLLALMIGIVWGYALARW
jgi:hypothetical protein